MHIFQPVMRRFDAIEATLEKIMSGLTDLQAAVAALEAEQTVVVNELATLSAAAGDPDATVETLAQQVNASVAAIQAAIPATASAAPAAAAKAP